MYQVFTSTNSHYKLKRQEGACLLRQEVLCCALKHPGRMERLVSPKVAGNICNSECQADQYEGSSQVSFQQIKCLFLISAEMSKILRHFWYFQPLLMRLNRFWTLPESPARSPGIIGGAAGMLLLQLPPQPFLFDLFFLAFYASFIRHLQ